ncbi:Kanamycin B dioxygenase [Lachnellula willkommii]|uniref:Kanamycin B dioxygenase n=1 Tax=Lachnellula willkommii TaxID=215461 RepID=A0A559MGX2_9HELO|nr:Kanamycin B dioxygenase [Lachnellula willkommii]
MVANSNSNPNPNPNRQEPKEVGDAPRTINPTPEELKASAYDTPNIEAAMVALHQDGLVVLKNVVDVAHVDHINSYMTGEADEIITNNAKPFNQGVKSPPLKDPEYLYNDVFFNPFVIQLMNTWVELRSLTLYFKTDSESRYLGAKPIWNFVTGNNALPHTKGLRQPVHKDITFFHPQHHLLSVFFKCPFYVIANVPLCPFNPTTGSTEFWLGSHASTSGHEQMIATPETHLANAKLVVGEPTTNVLDQVREERRKVRPPVQPTCDKGDIMLRDLRTWHAGMPNESDEYRIMLALGYQVKTIPLLDDFLAQLILMPLRYSLETLTGVKRHNGTQTIPSARNFP